MRFEAIGGTLSSAIENLSSLSELVRHGIGPLNAQYEAAQAAIRRAAPLPEVKGDADIYTVEQSTLLANNIDYHPRPVFQSYSVYTNYLIKRNVESLKLATAPQTIFFDVSTIDGRLPALDDGASWPELLTRYDIVNSGPSFPRLERRRSPGIYDLAPLLKTSIALGDALPIKNTDSLIWAHIWLRKTLLGSLLTTLVKAPIVNLEVTLHDGNVRQFRIVPAEASAGFLPSPLVENRLGFIALERPELRAYLEQQQVEKIRILPQRFGRFAYQNRVPITLETLTVNGRAPEMTGEVDAQLKQLKDLIFLNSGQKSANCNLAYGDEGPQMSAHASSLIIVEAPAAKKLTVRFGINDAAWKEGHPDGVDFRISALHAGEPGRLIWSRRLRPVQQSADRGLQEAHIDMRVGAGDRLMFETLPVPNGTTDWAWSYWGALIFE